MEWSDLKVTARYLDKEFMVARPAVVLEACGNHEANSYGEAILDWWLSLIPKDAQLAYINSKAHAFRAATPRVLQRVRGTLHDVDKSPQFYMFKDAPEFECGEHALEIQLGVQPVSEAGNVIYAAFPVSYSEGPNIEKFVSATQSLLEKVPIRTLAAGLGFNVVWGREWEQMAMPPIMATARRHLALDVRDRNLERFMTNSVKSAAWITYLCQELFEKLGGKQTAEELAPDVKRMPAENGFILRASDLPPLGDKNRGAKDIDGLRQINAFIQPIRESSWYGWNLFRIDKSDANAWFARLDQPE
jgi:hypothetical protein